MKEIPLTRGLVALVDDEDYERLTVHKWCATTAKRRNTYAARRLRDGQMSLMHREILGLAANQKADHKDCNGLNNQRSNIRPCSASQNLQNTYKRPGATSQFKGVHWEKCTQKWRARLQINRRTLSLGRFFLETEAAVAYRQAATATFGEFARFI